MGELKVFREHEFSNLIQTLNAEFHQNYGYVLLISKPLPVHQEEVIKNNTGIVIFGTGSAENFAPDWPQYLSGFVSDPANKDQLLWALEEARRTIEYRHEIDHLRSKMKLETTRLKTILRAAIELSDEKDRESLFEKILTMMRETCRAEGASLYTADLSKNELKFRHLQNEVVEIPLSEFSLPISDQSLAGACAHRREVIHIPDVDHLNPDLRLSFNRSVDIKTGYKTKSLLCFPVQKSSGDLVGVIQLINSKRPHGFTSEDVKVGKALSVHIAVALENLMLYKDIENLFDSFIRASVTAIESRDPTTAGHSERVALLTVRLAEEVSASDVPVFRSVQFSAPQIKELRYASLLHDFGKIGVPESVLLKEKKLFPAQLMGIMNRLEILKLAYPKERSMFEDFWQIVLKANQPAVSTQDLEHDLNRFLQTKFIVDGKEIALLTPEEHASLSIKKGSLTREDRALIESHVLHTYRFLSQIPWTSALHRIPEIALSHHEKLDGTGYPHRVSKEKIPLESQIMAITDIFDALTAADRPYKKSVPLDGALRILKEEAGQQKINSDLVQLFEQRRVFECLKK